jgi:hypothetical protein
VESACLLSSLFSDLQPLLLPALLVPDDVFNADDEHGPTHEYESKHEHESKLLSDPNEFLSVHDAVAPTNLNVPILLDSQQRTRERRGALAPTISQEAADQRGADPELRDPNPPFLNERLPNE